MTEDFRNVFYIDPSLFDYEQLADSRKGIHISPVVDPMYLQAFTCVVI